MKDKIELLDDNVKQLFKISESLVAINIKYLESIGIKDPVSLISIYPELFISSNEIVKKKCESFDIEMINEDPTSILDMI